MKDIKGVHPNLDTAYTCGQLIYKQSIQASHPNKILPGIEMKFTMTIMYMCTVLVICSPLLTL